MRRRAHSDRSASRANIATMWKGQKDELSTRSQTSAAESVEDDRDGATEGPPDAGPTDRNNSAPPRRNARPISESERRRPGTPAMHVALADRRGRGRDRIPSPAHAAICPGTRPGIATTSASSGEKQSTDKTAETAAAQGRGGGRGRRRALAARTTRRAPRERTGHAIPTPTDLRQHSGGLRIRDRSVLLGPGAPAGPCQGPRRRAGRAVLGSSPETSCSTSNPGSAPSRQRRAGPKDGPGDRRPLCLPGRRGPGVVRRAGAGDRRRTGRRRGSRSSGGRRTRRGSSPSR